MKENEKVDNKKINLKEKWNDKRERAKIELILYAIFFIGVIIFVRVGNNISNNNNNINDLDNLFIYQIEDNYCYDTKVNINDNNYEYIGKVLGYNSTIEKKDSNTDEYFYKKNDKYYKLDQDNGYILSNKNDIYDVINYDYMDINNIKEYIKTSNNDNGIYKVKIKVKISDIILNSSSSDYITIKIDNINNTIEIDYTNLLRINDNNITKAIVTITYSDINKIISLEE